MQYSDRLISLVFVAALTAVVTGTITDQTTGQPLTGVTVTTTAGREHLHARTDERGRFTFDRLADGTYVLHLSSPDVPPQTVRVRVTGNAAHLHLHACSTTLDYNCGGAGPGGS